MNAKKLWVEYLATAKKLYGSTFWATYHLMLLLIVTLLAALVMATSAVIMGNSAPASSYFIINSILLPIFDFAVVFQAINISVGWASTGDFDFMVKAE